MDYRDRHVVVTGGTGALGAAVVVALVASGAMCHVPWRDEREAERFAYRDHGQVKLLGPIELTDEAALRQFYEGIPDLWASIHIAGGFAMSPVAKTDKAALMHLLDMNLVSCFLCCSAAVNAIARSGKGGRIVNVAARHALEWRGGAGLVAYTASKAAVAALTVALSEEVAKQDILVNAVAPTQILTVKGGTPSIPDDRAEKMAKSIPVRRIATPEDVAPLVVFLASDANRYVTGETIAVTGGAKT